MPIYPTRTAILDAANPVYQMTITGAGLVLPNSPDWAGFLRWDYTSKGPTLVNTQRYNPGTFVIEGAQSYGFNSPTEFAFFDSGPGGDPIQGQPDAVYSRGFFSIGFEDSTVFPNDTVLVTWLWANPGPFVGGPQGMAVTITIQEPLVFDQVYDQIAFVDALIPASSSLATPSAAKLGMAIAGVNYTVVGIKFTAGGLSAINCWDMQTNLLQQVQPKANCQIGLNNWTLWSADDGTSFNMYLTRWVERVAGGGFDNDNYIPDFDDPSFAVMLSDQAIATGGNVSSGPLGFIIPYTDGTANAILVSIDWTKYSFIQITAADAEAQAILDYAASSPDDKLLTIAQDDNGLLYITAGPGGSAPTLATGSLASPFPPYIPPPTLYNLPCINPCQPMYIGRK